MGLLRISKWMFFLQFIAEVLSLRNLKITGQEAVAAGESVTFTCEYDLERTALYSVRWYFDSEEFYRYVPKESPPRRSFNISAGLLVDLNRSDEHNVTLVNLEQKQSGNFQCEASADAPLFHTETSTTTLFVVTTPNQDPKLSILSMLVPDQTHTIIGDTIKAKCTSFPSYPPVNFTWVVNGERHPSTQQGLSDSRTIQWEPNEAWSELIFNIDSHKLTKNRKILIRCETNIFSVYRAIVESQLYIGEEQSDFDGGRVSPTTDQRGTANRAGDPDNSALKASAFIFICSGKYIMLRLTIVWLLIYLIS